MSNFPENQLFDQQVQDPATFSDDYQEFLSGNESSLTGTDATVTPADFVADMDQLFPPVSEMPIAPMQMPMQMQMPGPPGARYHPEIGWYFPANMVGNMLPPPVPQIQQPFAYMPSPTDGYIPMATPQAQTVRPEDIFNPQLVPQPVVADKPQGRKRKQYFGPSAYFNGETNDSSKRQKTNDVFSDVEMADSESSTPVGTRPKRELKRGGFEAQSPADAPTPIHTKRKNHSLEQYCVCGSGDNAARVPRPRNAFILFRSQMSKEIARELKGDTTVKKSEANSHISRILGERWQKANKQTKQKYQEMADREKEKHALMYPNYRYVPSKGARAEIKLDKFGTPSCTCGAYARNMAKLQNQLKVAEPEELEEYEAPAPAAQMTAPSAPSALALPVRRSARQHANVTYAEPADPEMDNLEAELAAQLSEALSKPSPTSEGRPKTTPAPILTPTNSPPSHNTRAKSRQFSYSLPPLAESAEGEESQDFADLFGEDSAVDFSQYTNFDFEGDMAMTFDSAPAASTKPRPSSRGESQQRPGSSSSRSTGGLRRSPRHAPANN